jgi:hypothetical protein
LRAKFFFTGDPIPDYRPGARNVIFLHHAVGFFRRVALVNQRVAFFRVCDTEFV